MRVEVLNASVCTACSKVVSLIVVRNGSRVVDL